MSAHLLAYAGALLLVALSALVLLKENRQGRLPIAFGVLLLATIELFDSLAIRHADQFLGYKRLVLLSKSLLPATLLLYGMRFVRKSAGKPRFLAAVPLLVIAASFSSAALLLPMDEFYSGRDLGRANLLVLAGIGYWFYLGLTILCIAALVNLESVFAGMRGADRWRVKYEFLGVGAVLAVMIFYFSQALLSKAVNTSLQPVRTGVVIVSALLIGYSRLYRGKSASLAVSRQALYQSFTLVAVGLYFLALGFLGEGMKRFNISMTTDVSIFVAILSGLAFLILLLSEEIRRRLKVFIAKNFYAHKHDYREEWLGFSNALAQCGEIGEVRGAIIDRYQRVFGLRFAALYAPGGAGDTFALVAARDRAGLAPRVTLSPGLVGYFAETGRVMNPADGEYTPNDDETRFIRESEAWLLVPLLAGDHLEAFVVFGSQVVPEKLTYEDFDLMKIIGRQAVLSLKNFQLSEDLSAAREMAAVAKVSSFVIHDLKNLAYTFSLMMENAGEHIGEPDFQRDLVKSIHNTVTKMNGLIAKLKAFPDKRELSKETVDLARIVGETLDEVRGLKPGLTFAADLAPAASRADVQEIRKVALNLLLNACDAVGNSGIVRVRTGRRDAEAFLGVEDNGCGMSPTFVQSHLFKPFRTTKEKGLGIGLYQCRQIVEAHGGRIEVESREGEGTAFTVILPEQANGAPASIVSA
ncbi:MAG TPA: XrtA/PEP-CTERM system histidine kinase PrsK [Candidatus Methanoperedens sp.]|nr:XrtA/PEP-CTERM system histidine kinase PrsK [Candidatus Methanoperedens sp.]